jgi:hypothetical protein
MGVEQVLDAILLAQRQGLLAPEPRRDVQADGLLAEKATGALELRKLR